MRITVAVCTWNRAQSLAETLRSMAQMEVPPELDWELLVVDNGSTDGTPRVLRDPPGGIPLRATHEPNPGLSHARNRAVTEMTGDVVVWTDDDVRVSSGWLARYAAAFAEHPDDDFFGGGIEPCFLVAPPDWLTRLWDELKEIYSIRMPAPSPEITRDYLPFGANYALRARLQRALAYDARLGRNRGDLTGLEEVAVLEAALDRGHRGRWVPGATVEHLIPAGRLTPSYVRGVFEAHAAVEAERLPPMHGPVVGGAPLSLWKKWLQAELALSVSHPSRRPNRWMERLREASTRKGQLAAARGVSGRE